MLNCYFHVPKSAERANEKSYTGKFATLDLLFEELRTCGGVEGVVIDTADMGSIFYFGNEFEKKFQDTRAQVSLMLAGGFLRAWRLMNTVGLSSGFRYIVMPMTITKRSDEEIVREMAKQKNGGAPPLIMP